MILHTLIIDHVHIKCKWFDHKCYPWPRSIMAIWWTYSWKLNPNYQNISFLDYKRVLKCDTHNWNMVHQVSQNCSKRNKWGLEGKHEWSSGAKSFEP